MEVINLEQKLTTEQQVKAFNENVLGYYGNDLFEDFQYVFGISDLQLKIVEKEKGEWWGTMQNIAHYSMGQCIEMGYTPWKLTYHGLSANEIPEEGGSHKFHFSCEDKRIKRNYNKLG